MDKEQRKVIEGAFCSVLEKMAFMFAEPMHPPYEAPDTADAYMRVSMRFGGVLRGDMDLALPETICAEIAANMVGRADDAADASTQTVDAVKEVLNVTCGQVLTDLAGDRPMFELSIPTAEPMADDDVAKLLQDDESLAFTFDGRLGILRVRMGESG
ncbi:MAG: hypothetical protein GF331_22435 [Chitinivibrionales bacterium]|nr:hypothetical protein [Chitinivibrionales bacterium]